MRTALSFKHTVMAAALAIAVPFTANAQSFEKGTSAINLGLGLGSYGYLGSYLTNSAYRTTSPTFVFAYDLGVAELGPDVLGIGVTMGYNFQTYKYSTQYSSYVYNHNERWSNTIFGVRGTYHLNWWHQNEKLDLYGGVMTGFSIGSYSNKSERVYNDGRGTVPTSSLPGYTYYNGRTGGFRYGVFAGARYYFAKALGVYGEVGAGVTYLNGGLTLKF